MSKPRVLMFGWEYAPYFSGGLGIVTRSIIRSLRNQGMNIVFVLPKMPYKISEDQIDIVNASKFIIETSKHKIFTDIEIESFLSPYVGIEEFKYKMRNFISKAKEIQIFDDEKDNTDAIYGDNLIYEVEKYANRASQIAEVNPHSVIHTHDWMTAKAGVIAKKASGKPMIMHVHATEFDRTGGNPNQLVYDIEREGFQNAERIIAVSELTKQKIIEHYGINGDKVVVVHNAIDKYDGAKRLGKKLNKTDKIVLFLGRLTMQKGAEYLLEAAELVLRNKKRVKFVFIGQGDMMQYLINKSIDLGIEQKVMFAGFMNHDEVDRAYQMADVYVMPSVSEPFGITALEAIKNGTPVIVSKQSGVSEIISSALKVDFWDTDELANQILGIIRYKPLSKFMSGNALEELKNLHWDKQTKKIMHVYNELHK